MPSIGDLKPDKRNARRHNPRNVGMIEESIQRHGFGRSILTAKDGTIIAGNATWEAAGNVGIEDRIVVESDGTKVIDVRRTDVEPDTKAFHELSHGDNRTAELAETDAAVLSGLIDDGMVDPSWMYYEPELDKVLASLTDGVPFDPAAEWRGMPEFHQDDQMPVKQVIVNFASEAAVDAFARLVEQNVTMATKSVWYPRQETGAYRGMAYAESEDAA